MQTALLPENPASAVTSGIVRGAKLRGRLHLYRQAYMTRSARMWGAFDGREILMHRAISAFTGVSLRVYQCAPRSCYAWPSSNSFWPQNSCRRQ